MNPHLPPDEAIVAGLILVARIRVMQEREAKAAKWKEDRDRLLAAPDECLGRERARNEIRRLEREAGL